MKPCHCIFHGRFFLDLTKSIDCRAPATLTLQSTLWVCCVWTELMLCICRMIVYKSLEGAAWHLEFCSFIFLFCVSTLKNCLLALLKPVNRLYTHLVWLQTMLTSHLVKCECNTGGLSLLEQDNTPTFRTPLEICIECSNIRHWKLSSFDSVWIHDCSVC